MTKLIAHKYNNKEQLYQEHANNVSSKIFEYLKNSISFLDDEKLFLLAKCLGYYHDLGKLHPEWQEAIDKYQKPPFHSAFGAKFFLNIKGEFSLRIPSANNIIYILSDIIMSHHSGLNDNHSEDRLKFKSNIKLDEDKYNECINNIEWDRLSLKEKELLNDLNNEFNSYYQEDISRHLFFQTITRLLLSTLIDADRLDAEIASGNEKRLKLIYNDFNSEKMLSALNEYYSKIKPITNEKINTLRQKIRETAINNSQNSQGFYMLAAPVGSGKTLATMNFALLHSQKHLNIRRIIIALPFLSIIEQNSKVIKDIFESNNENIVLEHHSGLDLDVKMSDENNEQMQIFGKESWNAPIVITTFVQLIETLFSNNIAKLRKFHNIANSLIIIDEAHAISRDILQPTLKVLEILCEKFGCTVVFSTGTQHDVSKRENFSGIKNIKEIIPQEEQKELFALAIRHQYEHKQFNSISDLIKDMLFHNQPILCIVNTKKGARKIAQQLKELKVEFLHLSTNMYPYHRKKTLEKAFLNLKEKRNFILVSTQIIEAGVDISFPILYRYESPLEAIIQASGRCNRHGEIAIGKIINFNIEDDKDFIFPKQTEYGEKIEKAKKFINKNLDDPLIFKEYSQFCNKRINSKKEVINIINDLENIEGGNYKYEKISKNIKVIKENQKEYSLIINPNNDNLNRLIRNNIIIKEPTIQDRKILNNYSITINEKQKQKLIDKSLIIELFYKKQQEDMATSIFYALNVNEIYNEDFGLRNVEECSDNVMII